MEQSRWLPRCPEVDSRHIEALCRELALSSELATLLASRGLHDLDQAQQFLCAGLNRLPDPFLLKGMQAAVARLELALQDGELIEVHGDYDVDGISATALLVSVLRQFGARVDFHIPLRMEDGYGLSAGALLTAAEAGARAATARWHRRAVRCRSVSCCRQHKRYLPGPGRRYARYSRGRCRHCVH
jgi:single-stranded-DNA-specific exonuclease